MWCIAQQHLWNASCPVQPGCTRSPCYRKYARGSGRHDGAETWRAHTHSCTVFPCLILPHYIWFGLVSFVLFLVVWSLSTNITGHYQQKAIVLLCVPNRLTSAKQKQLLLWFLYTGKADNQCVILAVKPPSIGLCSCLCRLGAPCVARSVQREREGMPGICCHMRSSTR